MDDCLIILSMTAWIIVNYFEHRYLDDH